MYGSGLESSGYQDNMLGNSTSNSSSSSDGEEITPVDIIYTLGEVANQLSLVIIIITYTITKRRQTTSGRLMINFCLSLLLLYVESTFNKFISASGDAQGCVVIGVIGHWVFLAMLSGLATYCLWIYLKLVWIFREEPKHYTVKAAVITWVAPLIVALISVSPDYSQYHKTKHLLTCQAHGYPFYFGILLPSGILLLFSSVLMILTIVRIYKSQNNPATLSQTEEQAKLRRRTKVFIGLLIMVVLGWGFAVTATIENMPISVLIIIFVVFVICGYGQGVYLFLFVCVFSANVRKDWKNMLSNVMHFSFKTITNQLSINSAVSDTTITQN